MVKIAIALALALATSSVAHADPAWRVKLDSYASGELLGWPKHQCRADVGDHLRRVLLKYPYIEVIDGKMAARIDEKRPVPATRQTLGATFTASYDVTDTRTLVFTVRWQDATGSKDGKAGTVPVEVSIIERTSSGPCRETWLGLGKRI